ncbi:unnamed protein product [Brassica rapa subsp. trilocularis]
MLWRRVRVKAGGGLKWEMRSTVGGKSKVCGAGKEREQRSKHLDKVKALKVATFVSFTMVNPKNASSLFFILCFHLSH